MPPEDSVSYLPATISTAFLVISGVKLSNMIRSTPPRSRTCCSSSKLRTSISIFRSLPFSLQYSLARVIALSIPPLRSRKILAFFAGFSAFCFSAMLQMSASMGEYASDEMGFIVLLIGLTLAFVTLYLSLSSVVKANQKTIAMMKVIGYSQKECADSVINCYRPIAAVGFVIGSLYQYLLMNTMVNVVFSDLLGVKPKYSFDWNSFWITLVLFVVIYEGAMMFFSHQIKNQSVKSVMQE